MDKLREEVSHVIVGQSHMLDRLLIGLLSNGHVLLEGVPGLAKTLTAKLLAKTLQTGFSRIQFTPDLMPSDVLGTSVFNTKTGDFEFRRGPIFSNLILVDEINRAPAKTQSALFEVMEERQATVDGTTYAMTPPFMIIATQNPVEHEGTYRLPEAQLDRFLFKIEVDYPTLEEEVSILQSHHLLTDKKDFSEIKAVVKGEHIAGFQQKVRQVHVEQHLINYIAQIVNRTRSYNAIYLGASPRASIALMQGSKALAAMQGRDFVLPEDIKRVCRPVLAHRIILSPEKEMEGGTAAEVIKQLVETIEIPR
ncbi:MAG: AAA family ATPase [Bacteroidia bacterium]